MEQTKARKPALLPTDTSMRKKAPFYGVNGVTPAGVIHFPYIKIKNNIENREHME